MFILKCNNARGSKNSKLQHFELNFRSWSSLKAQNLSAVFIKTVLVSLLVAVQVWQCGGSMEVLPCARVAHIERTKKPYNNDIDYYAKRNALRAAEVWMDEYKSHVYMAWNIPMNVRFILQLQSLSLPASLRISFSHLLLADLQPWAPPDTPVNRNSTFRFQPT